MHNFSRIIAYLQIKTYGPVFNKASRLENHVDMFLQLKDLQRHNVARFLQFLIIVNLDVRLKHKYPEPAQTLSQTSNNQTQ